MGKSKCVPTRGSVSRGLAKPNGTRVSKDALGQIADAVGQLLRITAGEPDREVLRNLRNNLRSITLKSSFDPGYEEDDTPVVNFHYQALGNIDVPGALARRLYEAFGDQRFPIHGLTAKCGNSIDRQLREGIETAISSLAYVLMWIDGRAWATTGVAQLERVCGPAKIADHPRERGKSHTM